MFSRFTWCTTAALTLAVLAGCGKSPAPVGAPVPTPAGPQPGSGASAPAPGRPASPAVPGAAPAALGWQDGLTDIPLALGAGREAFLALATEQGQPGELRLSMAADDPRAAFRTLSAEATAPSPADTTTALRRLDQRLDGLKPQPGAGYRLQAVAGRRLGDTETVWVIATSNGASVTEEAVTARAVYVGEHCDVLVDTATGSSIDARARALGQAFDQRIWATDTRLFGRPLPVGPRGDRVTIVLSPVVGDGGRDTTLGYFTARDLFAPADAPDEPFLRHSNQGAYLYMADRVVARGREVDAHGTLAHEFQHLISATYKLYGKAGQQEAVWLNEALSMYAMAANGYGLPDDSRVIAAHVADYLAGPQRYSLTRWDLNPTQSAYGAAYLFATYMVERTGEDMLKALVAAEETGAANLDARLAERGLSFKQLFRDWVAATLLDGPGAQAPYAYRTLDLHGTYAGRRLTGVAAPAVSLPNAGRVPTLPYSASYLLLRGADGGPFTLDVAGAGSQAVGAFLSPR